MRARLAGLALAATALGALLLPAAPAAAPPAAAPPALNTPDLLGSFRLSRTGTVITIADCGGQLCGRVTALGTLAALDKRNPVAAQQSRRVCGLAVLTGLNGAEGGWRATLYDPENGTSYYLDLYPGDRGGLSVEGRWGIPVMTRSMRRPVELWERVTGAAAQTCSPNAPTS
jgi:uncharacterized protein (DUF2147 family)